MRWPVIPLLASLCGTAGIAVGCAPRGNAPMGAQRTATGKLPDLTRPIELAQWHAAESGEEPLAVVQRLAKTAGGGWVGVAPRPLELVRWKPDRGSGKTFTVQDVLKALPEKKIPLETESRKGYLLVYFGKKEELEQSKSGPTDEVTGLYAAAETGEDLVNALSDVLHIKIHAAPGLYRTRENLLVSKQQSKSAAVEGADLDEEAAALGIDGDADAPLVVEFKSGDRVSLDDLMQKLGSYFGAEGRKQGDGGWELLPLTEPHRVAQEIGRLQDVIKEHYGSEDEGFTSFAGRAGVAGSEEDADVVDADSVPELAEQAIEAFDNLALLGVQAVPTLATYLDAEKASQAQAAMSSLTAMSLPEASKALLEFGRELSGELTVKARPYRKLLLTQLVAHLARDLKPENAVWLAELLRDARLTPSLRLSARMGLLSAGKIDAVKVDASQRELPSRQIEFQIREAAGKPADPALANVSKPVTATASKPTGPGAVKPLATTKLLNGDTWAVFTSARWGNPDDLWLARSERGNWTEYLFTGRQFERSNPNRGYVDPSAPSGGGCVLEVKDEQVIIRPPDPKLSEEFDRISKQFQNSGQELRQDPAKWQKLMQRYSELQSQVQNVLRTKLTFTLEGLRKDSDKDTLTDLLEERLGSDPKKLDTDGDGLSDDRDANPLIKSGRMSDQTSLLQSVFAAAYGNDPAIGPTVVLLDEGMHQEFLGAQGPVICLSPAAHKRRIKQLKGLRTLQFGGPKNAQSSLLLQEGPCLLNEARTRAEVQFWMWPASEGQPPSPYGHYGGQQTDPPRDYVANFVKKRGWLLQAVKPWGWKTAEDAVAERAQLEQREAQGM